jgi:putative ABC transport system substrate-binding protein
MSTRREFVTLLGSTAAWPLAARAQQGAIPVVGFLNGAAPNTFAHLAAAFRQGLNEVGYVENQNVAIEYRWAEGRLDRLPELAADLIRRRVTVIALTGPRPRGFERTLTTGTPVVATFRADPVRLGYIDSINRPGGNLTGASIFTADLEAKRLELLHELVPKTSVIGVLIDPTFSEADLQLREV